MPLVGLADAAVDQGRVCADPLGEQRAAVGHTGHDPATGSGRRQRRDRRGQRRGRRGGVRPDGSGRGDGQSEVLHDRVGVVGPGVDVDSVADDGDDEIGAARGIEHDALDVVQAVEAADIVGLPDRAGAHARREVVPVDHLAGDDVGDHQVEVVDQLRRGGGIARRIGPDERQPERCCGGILREDQTVGTCFTGGDTERLAGVIGFDQADRAAIGLHPTRERARQIRLPPTAIVPRFFGVRKVGRTGRLGAVQEQRFVARGGRTSAGLLLEIFLHLREQTRHGRGRHAGAGLVAIIRGAFRGQVLEKRVVVGVQVRREIVVQLPLRGTGREHEGAGRDEVRLEPAGITFGADADVAAARISGDLERAVGQRREREVRLVGEVLVGLRGRPEIRTDQGRTDRHGDQRR